MSRSRSKSWRRFIFTTLLWSLALLLLTNVGWSLWAAWCWQRAGVKGFAKSGNEASGASMCERDGIHVRTEATRHESLTRTIYFVHVVVVRDTSELQWVTPRNRQYADVTPVWIQQETARSLDLSWEWIEREPRAPGGTMSQFYWSSGWPCRLLWSGIENSVALERPMVIAGLPVIFGESYGLDEVVCLPTNPIWTGQMHTGLLWLGVVVLTRVLVYHLQHGLSDIRRRHGLCTQCAYNLRGNVSGVCPECGAAVNGERG